MGTHHPIAIWPDPQDAFSARDRDLRHWMMTLMFTVGAHLAALGVCAQTYWTVIAPRHVEPEEMLVMTTERDVVSPELVPQIIETEVKPPQLRRLAHRRLEGAPNGQSTATAGQMTRRLLAMEPTHVSTTELTSIPRRPTHHASLTPRFGKAPLPGGADGKRVSLKPALGEAVGECVVFLYDNSQTGEEGRRMREALIARLEALSPLQYFYVVAFDQSARRMFSEHSPELRPLPPTRYNSWMVRRWLETLATAKSTAGAEWAIVHALQLRPREIHVLSSGVWPRAASAYLRSTNRGPNQVVRVPVHVLAFNAEADVLKKVARANRGTFELTAAPQ